jgi:LysR family transcriptional activator of nhaA
MSKSWLNYHHLYYFYIIAKSGSISKASKELRLGQPALSTQLKGLESTLGVVLFERTKSGFNLTEDGKVAYAYSEQLFKLGEELLAVVSERKIKTRHIRLGALDGIPKHVIARIVESLSKVSSGKISVLEGSGDQLLQDLKEFKLDLLVSNYPPPVSDRLMIAKPISRLKVGVYGSEKFKKLKKDFPKSLNDQPFIISTSHSKLRQDLDHYFTIEQLSINPIVETQDTALQKILGVNGKGLLALPNFAVEELVDERKLFKLGDFDLYEELWMITPKRSISEGIFQKFLQEFKLE